MLPVRRCLLKWAALLKRLLQTGGYLGLGVALADLADHIDHVCQLAGNTDQAAIGGDTDGQGGRDGAPLEIDTVADYRRLANILADRNYGDDAIAGVMYRNWQRFYSKWLPAA